ncbi:hypothetical protein TNCV_1142181 [Trichonephila clavipes]|nr:hypothetical protein TNCV_1142181 [Trichonephila clavipes]
MRVQTRLRPLTRRSDIRRRMLLKHPWKLWRCWLWPHLVVTTRGQDPFLEEQEHDLVEEYRSDDERHVALQSTTTKAHCYLHRNMFETETDGNTSIPLPPLPLNPSTCPFAHYKHITVTCSRTPSCRVAFKRLLSLAD